MKKIYTILFTISLISTVTSQVKIFEPSHPTANLNNATINVTGLPSDNVLDYYLHTVNESASDLDISIKRTELSVLGGTKNATCWEVCPNPIFAGAEITQVSAFSATIVAGDTNASFSAHFYPETIDGCSSFLYEWVDASNNATVYASITINYYHSTGNCTVGLEDLNQTNVTLSPNPANDNFNISMSYVSNNTKVDVINLLGQNVYSTIVNSEFTNINTSVLPEGVYIINITSNGKSVSTEKLIIKH